jgi:hypothetical protein
LYDALHQGRGADDALKAGVDKASVTKIEETPVALLLGLAVVGFAATPFQASV